MLVLRSRLPSIKQKYSFLTRPILHSSTNPPTIHANSSSLAAVTTTDKLIITLQRKMAQAKSRPNPVIMKLDTPQFNSIFTEELKTLVSVFKEYGYEIRVAGGAVRDLLLGQEQPKDLDFATTATPDEMIEMFTAESIRMINMNGVKHGTITPRINDKVNFEVTTLRVDVVTDGRHAKVQFTTDWMLDSFRRDLTINSMFLDMDGSVYDYFYGYDDLQKRKVRFVGDAKTRIQEDYLRILRYFRFYGRIAVDSNAHEPSTLTVITNNSEGLQQISGERIWIELKQILDGRFAGDLLIKMLDECQLGSYIGLPRLTAIDIDKLRECWTRSGHLKLHPITLLTSVLQTQDHALALNARLKLSAFERDLAVFLMEHRDLKPHIKPLMPYQQLVLKSKSKVSDVQQWVVEVLKYNNSPYLEEFKQWIVPKFPVNGTMLKEKGVESGRFMGVVMTELKHYWADNDFNLSSDDLLERVPHMLSILSERKKKK